MKVTSNQDDKLPVVLRGNSMTPFLQEGDVVEFRVFPQPMNLNQAQRGEIYLTRDRSEWIVHRAVYSKGQLCLKGDFSCHVDSVEFVWGVGVQFFRQGKKMSLGDCRRVLTQLSEMRLQKGRAKVAHFFFIVIRVLQSFKAKQERLRRYFL